MEKKDMYLERGVSSGKEDVHKATENLDKGLYPNAFCKILPDILGGDPDYCNIMHADGAGTKSSLAYMYWKETGDMSVWPGIAQDAIIMNIDDLLCVGAATNILFSSTIGRNTFHIPAEVISGIINGGENVLSTLRKYGIDIYNAGGETADLPDIVRTIVVDATMVVRMKKSDLVLINPQPGDVLIQFTSFGQTEYEKEYNSGMGSNGLTSARHDLFDKDCLKYPESYDTMNMKESLTYIGRHKLTESAINGLDWGKVVLSPTRTYGPLIKMILDRINRCYIHGFVHNTGGGQTKVKGFMPKEGILIEKDFSDINIIAPVFQEIHNTVGTPWERMFPTFNMGYRMETYVDPIVANPIIGMAKSLGIDARVAGHVKAKSGKSEIFIKSPDGEIYVY